ncbi:MAG: anthranilate phosphoribosyltransferase [Pirellulales bacterium]
MLESTLGSLAAGRDLSQEEMAETIDAIMEGSASESEIALLLTTLRAKGETVAEVAGAAQSLRRHMVPLDTRRQGVVDTCGTGGDHSGTFNISTAAALVTAAAGVPVAKHGNRSVSSKSGSADVLNELGVRTDADHAKVEACLDELGICFCFAPLFHPAMKRVAEVRRKLGVPTIFNLLGPLCNPAGAPFQLLGVSGDDRRTLLAEALALLGTRRAVVVAGEDGLDEVTLAGRTQVTLVEGGQTSESAWEPEDFGLQRAPLGELTVDGPSASAAMIRDVLAGKSGPARDIVVLNAAAALWVAAKSPEPAECARMAAEAIDSGAASDLLQRLAQRSQ